MPGKPSRRVRRRQGGNAEPRPRPAPPVSSQRIVRTPRREATNVPDVERPDAQVLPETPAASVSQPTTAAAREDRPRAGIANPGQSSPNPSESPRPRAGAANTLRRGATASARALEAQREERVRRETLGDLKYIAVAAAITVVALGVAAVVL